MPQAYRTSTEANRIPDKLTTGVSGGGAGEADRR
jgi:hypothetical protein